MSCVSLHGGRQSRPRLRTRQRSFPCLLKAHNPSLYPEAPRFQLGSGSAADEERLDKLEDGTNGALLTCRASRAQKRSLNHRSPMVVAGDATTQLSLPILPTPSERILPSIAGVDAESFRIPRSRRGMSQNGGSHARSYEKSAIRRDRARLANVRRHAHETTRAKATFACGVSSAQVPGNPSLAAQGPFVRGAHKASESTPNRSPTCSRSRTVGCRRAAIRASGAHTHSPATLARSKSAGKLAVI